MSTILYKEIVFGPIQSRRLGISLGVNLLPLNGKLCTFDCIYCECGFNSQGKGTTGMPTKEKVWQALESKLSKMKEKGEALDVITFAGNGEPTLHPQFASIVEDTITLRNIFFPDAKISVLSNGTMVHKEDVFAALLKVDNNILKMDAVLMDSIRRLNRPNFRNYSIKDIIKDYKRFNGNLIIQTMFLNGSHDGKNVSNTSELEITDWLDTLQEIHPKLVMIYTIDRETPEKNLTKMSLEQLNQIADRVKALGLTTSVAG